MKKPANNEDWLDDGLATNIIRRAVEEPTPGCGDTAARLFV